MLQATYDPPPSLSTHQMYQLFTKAAVIAATHRCITSRICTYPSDLMCCPQGLTLRLTAFDIVPYKKLYTSRPPPTPIK